MFRIFRKVRQQLLSENKLSKYLLYALGEIALVMIGILLALQVNTWNQERILKKKAAGYLNSLIEDIASDTLQYDYNINNYEQGIIRNKRVLVNDDYKLLEVDSIVKLVVSFYEVNRISKQTFEKIKNTGLLEFLGSDGIEKKVNDYYNVEITYYDELLRWDKKYSDSDADFWTYNEGYETSSLRSYNTNALGFIDNGEKRKRDLIILIESTLGRNHLKGAIDRKAHAFRRVNELKAKANKLIETLQMELDEKE